RAGGVREQGQSDQVPQPEPGRRDLLQVAPARRQGRHHDVGAGGAQRRVGQQADQPLRPQLRLRDLRLLQGAHAEERRLQGLGEGAAGFGLGYSGIGYATAGVRAVPLTEKDGGKCIEATADNAYSGAYPLARFLYVYVNKAPGKSLDPLTREFVKVIMSKEGQ